MVHHLEHAKAQAAERRSNVKAYLELKFLSVDKPLVVEVSDDIYMEFEITDYVIGDDGVGSFEFHGFKGNHSRTFVDVRGITVVAVNGEEPSKELIAEVQSDFRARLIHATCEELP